MRSRWRVSPSRCNWDAEWFLLGTSNGDCCAQATAGSLEIEFTSCVARCDALAVGVGWSGPTGPTGGSSRPIRWTGVSDSLDRCVRCAVRDGRLRWTMRSDRWPARPIGWRCCTIVGSWCTHACRTNRHLVRGCRSMASDADARNTVDRSLGAVGAMWWFVVSDAGGAGCGWLTVVDGSVNRRCTFRSTRGGSHWSSGAHRLARADSHMAATTRCVDDTARSSGRSARFVRTPSLSVSI